MTTKTQELVREALDLGLEAAELRLAAAKESYRGYSSRWRSEEAAVDAIKAGIAAYRSQQITPTQLAKHLSDGGRAELVSQQEAGPVGLTDEQISACIRKAENGHPYHSLTTGNGDVTHFARLFVREALAAQHATSEPAEGVARDADRLDWEWLQRQDFEELVICMLSDCPGDGNYFVGGDAQQGEGKTLKEAVRAARLAEKGRPASDESLS
jgi:hypothetical protein